MRYKSLPNKQQKLRLKSSTFCTNITTMIENQLLSNNVHKAKKREICTYIVQSLQSNKS